MSSALARPRRISARLLLGLALLLAGGMPAIAAMPSAGTALQVQAMAVFAGPSGVKETVYSNVSVSQVAAVEAIGLAGDGWLARSPGSRATLAFGVTNQGNVTSQVSLKVVNANSCEGYTDTADLSSLRVVIDANSNGVADPAELAEPEGKLLNLRSGETVALLVLGDVPASNSGGACLQLSASTQLQSLTRTLNTFVSIADNPVLQLSKTAYYSQPLMPGGAGSARYNITATNAGSRAATTTGKTAAGQSITLDGVPLTVMLLSDAIPSGARFIAQSLVSSHANAVRLYRMAGDPPAAYRSQEPASGVVEVAVGYPVDLAAGQSVAMQFDVAALPTAGQQLNNVAQAHFGNVAGVTGASLAQSNTAIVPVAGQRLALAHWLLGSKVNYASPSVPDNTVTYHLALRVRNDGDTPLYNLQLPHLLAGASLWGAYTSDSVPGTGQYTVVPGSLRLVDRIDSATRVAVNAAFTGQGAQTGLLPSGANDSVLPVGAEFTLWYSVRVNVSHRANTTVYSQITGQAALNAYSLAADASDVSTNASNPDPDGDGNAANNSDATPIQFPDVASYARLASGLKIEKTVTPPSVVDVGVFDLTYTIRVRNDSDVDAPYVRVVDNLACTFNTQDPALNVAKWELISPPKASYGVLPVSAAYTGAASCDAAQQASGDPTNLPQDPALIINNASHSLSKGASEEYKFTVRVTQREKGKRSAIDNKAWLAALSDTNLVDPGILAGTTVTSLLVDPQGYVYDSVTRQPVVGAVVTLTRQSCDGGVVPDLTAEQVFGGDSGVYTFNANGNPKAMSMTTGADGQYQFFWKVPPVADICTYSLTVTPPASHVASKLLPAQTGVYGGCDFVVPERAIPTGSLPTTWYAQMRTGYKAGNTPAADCPFLHNNIPLDPAALSTALLLSKQADKNQAEMGDFVDFQLKLVNHSGVTLGDITFDDVLPAGFSYVPGSSWLGDQKVADPVKTSGHTGRSSLSYSLGSAVHLNDKADLTLRYRLRIGVGAMSDTDAVNTAVATAKSTVAVGKALSSNTAQARVRVSGGVFSNLGFAVGKVWADCNRNGLQDDEREPGIPGVRLYLEDGTSVITDQFGRWSLYGLKPVTHALRLDQSTLPAGARLALLDQRQAGQPHSRFLDVKNGELVRADFAVSGCEAPDLLRDIEQRQVGFANAVEQQLQALVSARLPTESRLAAPGDVRGLPASGAIAGAAPSPGFAQPMPDSQTAPLIALPAGLSPGLSTGLTPAGAAAPGASTPKAATVGAPSAAAPSAGASGPAVAASLSDALLGPLASLSSVPLEEVIEKLPARAAFIEFKEGDTVASNQVNVRVTGPQQSHLRLSVNGQRVPDVRIGKKSVITATGLVAYEYIAVRLNPGINTLLLEAVDEFGNVRQQAQVRVRAPGDLGRVQLLPQGPLWADPLRPIAFKLRLTDAAGVPITARTAVTLEAQGAQWLAKDLSATEPGVQIFVENGEAELRLQGPAQQGVVPVRVSAGPILHDEALTFLPALRPLQGIGVVEGVLDLSRSGRLPLTQAQAANAFEQELTGLSSEHGDQRAGGRAAFYFKGAIRGEYLLTAAYDSDKAQRDRLFRDIRPDEFYPVYGDGSVRGFDAQSSGRLYVRIDKNRSFVLLGDFNTASSPEVRQISQYGRALNGVQHRYQDGQMRVTSFYAETNATQQVEEIPANGLSFYNLSGVAGDIRPGSEKVELIVRDRQQPQVVLSSRSLTRLVDYSFEPLTRRLTLVQPLASYDANLNPQSIRVTYELDLGGPNYKVMGTDVQVKASDTLQLGAVAVRDENPQNPRELRAATALARLGESSAVSAELAQTQTELKGSGQAARVTLRHDSGALKAQAQVIRTDTAFDNLSSTAGAGRTEATGIAEYAMSEATRLRGEAYASRDSNASAPSAASSERTNVGVAVTHKLSEQVAAEVGVRHGNSTGNTAGGFSYSQVGSTTNSTLANSSIASLGGLASTSTQNPATSTTVRARLTARPESLPRLQVFGEAEQDVQHSERRALTGGASYGLTEKTRVYAQHAFVSSLSSLATVNGQNLRNATVVGVDSAYMEGGRLYNEYRATSQAAPQNATGLRNTFKLGDWRLNGGVERVQTVGANPAPSDGKPATSTTTVASTNATTVALGADWGQGPWRLSSAFERRTATTSKASLYSLAGAWRVDNDLTLLARLIDTQTQDIAQGGHNHIQRQQIGLAWRPAHADRWNVLSRYEHRLQDVAAGNASGAANLLGLGNTSLGRTDTHIVSTHAHWQIDRQQSLSLRWAGKISRLDDAIAPASTWAHLVHGRYTRDLAKDWDIGLQAGRLWSAGGASQNTLGLEVGYQVTAGLWLSAGYNVLGLRDPDLTGQNYTSRGAYVRLRWKFDEAELEFGEVAGPAGRPSGPLKGSLEQPLDTTVLKPLASANPF